MNASIAKARQKVIAAAEANLRRPLAADERRMIEGFAPSLALHKAYEELFKSCEPKVILGVFADIGGKNSLVRLFDSLANSTASMAQDRAALLKTLSAKASLIVRQIDFEACLSRFSGWLLEWLRREPPPSILRAMNFSLYESEAGFKVRVLGANHSKAKWNSNPDWSPEQCAPLEALSQLWLPLQKAGAESWVVMQAVVMVLVKAFFTVHAAEFQKAAGAKKIRITVGFVDGDLYEVKTPVSPAGKMPAARSK